MKIFRIIAKIALVAELVVLLVFREYFNITVRGSFLAFFLMISPMISAFDRPRRARADFKYDGKDKKLIFIRPCETLKDRVKYALVMIYYLSPLHLPIIFFFSDMIKLLMIFAVYGVLMAVLLAYLISSSVKNHKLNKADAEKLRKEQEEKEELGKFK